MSAATVKCPTCGRKLQFSSAYPHRPFCSERCKLIDLGAWLSEERSIAGESVPQDPEEDSPSDREAP